MADPQKAAERLRAGMADTNKEDGTPGHGWYFYISPYDVLAVLDEVERGPHEPELRAAVQHVLRHGKLGKQSKARLVSAMETL